MTHDYFFPTAVNIMSSSLSDLLTIVIPCKNEGTGIQTCLRVLNSAEKHPELRGVRVLVADASTDNTTPSIIDATALECSHLKIERIAGGLPAIARNAGARRTTTPFVLFLDADIFVEHPIQIDPRYDLATHRFCSTDNFHWVYRVFDGIQWLSRWTSPFCLGGFMLFRTSVFWELGGFNEHDTFAEDYRLSCRVPQTRFRVYRPYVYTSARRFRAKGVYYMMRLMWLSWWHRNNPQFFSDNQGYWS